MDWKRMCPLSIFERMAFLRFYGGLIITISDTILKGSDDGV
jgi:hypothetical protein